MTLRINRRKNCVRNKIEKRNKCRKLGSSTFRSMNDECERRKGNVKKIGRILQTVIKFKNCAWIHFNQTHFEPKWNDFSSLYDNINRIFDQHIYLMVYLSISEYEKFGNIKKKQVKFSFVFDDVNRRIITTNRNPILPNGFLVIFLHSLKNFLDWTERKKQRANVRALKSALFYVNNVC